VAVERDFVDLNGCRRKAHQHSSCRPWSTHHSTSDARIKVRCQYAKVCDGVRELRSPSNLRHTSSRFL
jgi:hypothetical protein